MSKQKSCLITGVGPGTGRALVERFAADGYQVAMMARSEGRLREIHANTPGTHIFACDVSDPAQLTEQVEAIKASVGAPTVVVHNAVGGAFGTFLDIQPEQLETNFQINTMALLRLAQLTLPDMINLGGGTILCTGNTSAYRGKAQFALPPASGPTTPRSAKRSPAPPRPPAAAVAEPRDGTMISVAADAAAAVPSDVDSLKQLQCAVDAAESSVEATPDLNPVLKDAGVVDAGARGLEFMLRGMAGALAGDPIPDVPAELGAIDPSWLARRLDDEGEFDGFCTEFVVAGVSDVDSLRDVLAGDDETVDARARRRPAIHIHTTEPADVYALCEAAGTIRAFRAVDMRAQAARTHEAAGDPAVIAVAQGSGFVRVFTELGAAAIVSGGAADNPSVEMLFSAAESVKGEDVIILPNNHNVAPAAQRAGDLAAEADDPQRILVIDNDSQARRRRCIGRADRRTPRRRRRRRNAGRAQPRAHRTRRSRRSRSRGRRTDSEGPALRHARRRKSLAPAATSTTWRSNSAPKWPTH